MNYDRIIHHLYFGNSIPTSPLFHLIVNCTHEIPFSPFCENRVRIPVNDDAEDYKKIIQFILQTNVLQKIHTCVLQGKNVLVHCFGEEPQRSFVIIACYLIHYYEYTPKQALQFIHDTCIIHVMEDIHFTISIFAYYYLQKKIEKI
jgi:hypothetical protein